MLTQSPQKLVCARMPLLAICLLAMFASLAPAQYVQVNLVANRRDPHLHAMRIDPNLINSWGLAFSATSPFWTSNEGTGTSTLYRHFGQRVALVVTVPPAAGTGTGKPTGIVQNSTGSTTSFVVSAGGKSGAAAFIFATLDGTISGWNPNVNATKAIIAVDNSSSQAVYTGLAIASTSSANFLFAADARNNRVDVFDGTFTNVGELTDPSIPSGFTPYGVQAIKGQIYVTYASLTKAGGFVDVFNTDGTFVKTLVSDNSGAHLNQAWGLAMAPANFGKFSNDLLVGNVKDGLINAFDPSTGAFLGWLSLPSGKAITISGLWALKFGGGSVNNGKTNQLFFTAGPNNFADGLLGMIFPIGANSPGLAP